MSGKPGQIQRQARRDTGRQRMWQSMRILRRFSLPDLARTAEVKVDNARKYVLALERHGFLCPSSGSDYVRGVRGTYKYWSLRRNPGPDHPLVCERCGLAVMAAQECKLPAPENPPSAIRDPQSNEVQP